jgi:hypothetical protein
MQSSESPDLKHHHILHENPYDLPLDEPELLRALRPELPLEVLRWLMRWDQAWIEALEDELRRRESLKEQTSASSIETGPEMP